MKSRKIFQGVLVAIFVFTLICPGNLRATGKADDEKVDDIKTNTFTANEINVTGKTRTKTLQVFDKLEVGTGTLYLSGASATTTDENALYANGDLYIQSPEEMNFLTIEGTTYNTIINGRNRGMVGIGTIFPNKDLHIKAIFCPVCELPARGPTTLRMQTEARNINNNNILFYNVYWDIVASRVLRFKTAEVGGSLETIMTLTPDKNVGIGTANPMARLHINGSKLMMFERQEAGYNNTQAQISIDNNNQGMNGLIFLMSGNNGSTWNKTLSLSESGNVGIGTAAPSAPLHVNSRTTDAALVIERDPTDFDETNESGYEPVRAVLGISSNYGSNGLRIRMSADNGSTWKDAIHIAQDGKIGVNTTQIDANSAALTVCGTILCTEIVVEDIACDFVFEDHYKLDRLSDVEEYIKVNKHLPGVPPASVTKKGVNLGEFNQILLQKVEELTLYMIELKKENEQMKREIEKLKRK